jgi:hypothetical protein
MTMETSDIVGSIGTVMMLMVYLLNLSGKLPSNNLFYILMNLFGGICVCAASVLIEYVPLIILEGTWALGAGWALYIYLTSKNIK